MALPHRPCIGLVAAVLAAAALAPGALAQTPGVQTSGAQTPGAAAACAAPNAALPSRLSGWTAKSGATAAARTADLPSARISVGAAAQAKLVTAASVSYPVAPQKPPAANTYGGLLELVVKRPGDYQVALSTGAWIDLLNDGRVAVESRAHAHGPPCSTIHKLVDFRLQPGRYVLQISGSAEPVVGVLVTAAQIPGA